MNEIEKNAIILETISEKYHKNCNLKETTLLDPSKLKEIARMARQNGVLYAFLEKLHQTQELPEVLKDYWIEQEKKKKQFILTIQKIDKLSKSIGFKYMIIKVPGTIPHVPRDIDIYVNKEDKTRIYRALKIIQTETARNFLPVDLYTSIQYYDVIGILDYFLWSAASSNSIFEISYMGIDDELNLLLTLVHAIFGHHRLTMLDFIHVQILLGKVDLQGCREYADANGWIEIFDSMLGLINKIDNRILTSRDVAFPYLIDQKIVIKLLTRLGLNLDSSKNRVLYSLFLKRDKVIRFMERSVFYEYLLGRFTLRRYFNCCLCYSTKLFERVACK